jgi:hypothetical protein
LGKPKELTAAKEPVNQNVGKEFSKYYPDNEVIGE